MADHDLTNKSFVTFLATTNAFITVKVPERSVVIRHLGVEAVDDHDDANDDPFSGVIVVEDADDGADEAAYGAGNILPVRAGGRETLSGKTIRPNSDGDRVLRFKAYEEAGLVSVHCGEHHRI